MSNQKEWKPNKLNVPKDWDVRIENFLNESFFNLENFFWQFRNNLSKKTTKVKKVIGKNNSVFQSVDEKYYPPKSIFIEKQIENKIAWVLPTERYKKGLSFYNKMYEVSCIHNLFGINEEILISKTSTWEEQLKVKSALNQLKLNKNKEFKLTSHNFLTILNLFNSFEEIFSNKNNQKYNQKLNVQYWKIKDNFKDLLDKDSFELIAIIETEIKSKLTDEKYKTISFLRDIVTHYHNYVKQKSDLNSYIYYKNIIFNNDIYIFL